jgi:hypothetical protein
MHAADAVRRRSTIRGLLLTLAIAVLLSGGHGVAPFRPTPSRGAEAASDQAVTPRPLASALAWRLRCLARAGAERWHAAGHRGKGIKVAVLDSGFRGFRNQLGQSLPRTVLAKSFRTDGNLEARDSQHGILCAEVVHALAPEAELLFANWEPDAPKSFLEAVGWARREGAQVLTCSVIMPSWSDGEGGGPIHAELSRLLGGGARLSDSLCFASAGNTAQRHWSGPFRDHGDGLHEWKPGVTDNGLTPWGGVRVSVEVCWRGAANYDLAVYDRAGGEVARSDAKPGEERTCAVVRFDPQTGHRYSFRVHRTLGDAPFHCVALHSGLEHTSVRGSVCFPGDGAQVLAVGAVNETGRRMAYSSCGPNSARPKPDLVAAVPFPSLWRTRPFAGTSAAAPQAAGLAAVLWSRHRDWTAEHVRNELQTAALDLGPRGHDPETGYGLVRLPDDVKAPMSPPAIAGPVLPASVAAGRGK